MSEQTKRACSFCGKPDTDALAMIAATRTDAVICGGCVTAASGELLELANRALHMARDASVARNRDEEGDEP